MFIPRYFFEKFTALLESHYAISQRQTEDGLQRVLAAKDAEVRAVIAAKDAQVAFLTAALVEQRGLVAHERQRAEAAVDILLTRDAGAGPIRNADLIRQVAEREAAGDAGKIPRPDRGAPPLDEFKRVMAQVADVLSEDDDRSPTARDEVLTVAGGAMPN